MSVPTVAEIVDPARQGYHASIDGLLVRLAVGPDRPLVTETAELQPQRFATEANPEDVIQSFGDIHSQSDWTGGEGLLNRFRRRGTDADATRFWSSQGINVSPSDEARPEELRLLPATEQVENTSVWTERTSPTDSYRDIAAGGGLFVAVGAGGDIATSPDGVTWTPRTSGTANTLRAVAFDGSQWVAVGDGGVVLTSPDATTWTSRTSGVAEQLNDVSHGDGLWVAVGNTDTIITSPDAITWTSQTTPTDFNRNVVAHGDGLWVAFARPPSTFDPIVEPPNGVLATSPDGVTWTAHDYLRWAWDAIYVDGLWVVVGGQRGGSIVEGEVRVSDDVTTLETVYSNFDVANFRAVAHDGDAFKAVGEEGTVLASTDGETWEEESDDLSGSLIAVAVMSSTWVVAIGSLWSSTQARARIAHVDETLWVTNGKQLRKTTDALAADPTFVDDDPHAGEAVTDVEDIASLGSVPYAALGANGIHRDDGGWAHWSDVEAVRVWSVLDRIVASTGPQLYEADSGATSTLLYTLPDGDHFTEVVDAAGTILASATNGFIYAFTLDDQANLTVAGQTRLKDESPVAMAARSNLVFIVATQGDELRLWRGRVDGPAVVDLQLMREWTASAGTMTASRDRVLVGVLEGGESHVWRIELTTMGIFKAYAVGSSLVDGLATVGGKTFAGVRGEGVLRESDTLETEGYLIGSLSDFFRAEDKSWVTGWADVAIDQGESVTLWYTTDRQAMFDPDHPSWHRVMTYTTSSSAIEVALGPKVVSRALAGMVKLNRSSNNTSPRVRSVAFRAYPGPGDVIVNLPVDVGDQVERKGRRRTMVPGLGIKVSQALREREGRAAEVSIFRTDEHIHGLIERVATPVPAMTARGSVTQMAMVSVRGRRVAASRTIDVGTYGAYGNAQWGAMSWGGEPLEETS